MSGQSEFSMVIAPKKVHPLLKPIQRLYFRNARLPYRAIFLSSQRILCINLSAKAGIYRIVQ